MTDVLGTSVDGRPLTKRGSATRRRLLDAAERCFGDVGYHEASVVKITEEAGVAHGTFYLYFASKKAIFDELIAWCEARLARFKVPRSVHFVAEIPRNGMGKAQKQELVAR